MIVFATAASGPASPLPELLAPEEEVLDPEELLVPEELDVPELEPELDDAEPSKPESSPGGLAPPDELELQP
jgi:hypothetical protein